VIAPLHWMSHCGENRSKAEKICMWLEQTLPIWAPLACAAIIWIAARLGALGRDVRSLQVRVTQLEEAGVRATEIEDRAPKAA
jgi:hypothetical protein